MDWILTGLNFRLPFLFILNRRQPGFSYVISLSVRARDFDRRSDMMQPRMASVGSLWYPVTRMHVVSTMNPPAELFDGTQFGSRFNRVYVSPPRTPANLISIRKGNDVPWVLGGDAGRVYAIREAGWHGSSQWNRETFWNHTRYRRPIAFSVSVYPISLCLILANDIFFYLTFIERV